MNLSSGRLFFLFLAFLAGGGTVLPSWAASEVRLLVRTPANVPRVTFAPVTQAWLNEAAQVRVAIWDGARPPLHMGFEADVFEGLTADMLGILQSMLGVPLKILRYKDRAEAVAAIGRGEVDMLGLNDGSQPVSALLNFSIPYLLNQKVLLRCNSAIGPAGAEVGEERLAVVGASADVQNQLREHYPRATLVPMGNHLNALTALVYGQVDVVRTDAVTGESLISRFYPNDLHVAEGVNSPTDANIDFAVSARMPHLLDALNQALAAIPLAEMLRLVSTWGVADDHVIARKPLSLTSAQRDWIAAHPSLKVLVVGANAPLSFYDAHGNAQGLGIDVLRLISRYTGLNFEIESSDGVGDMVQQLHEHKADILATLVVGDYWAQSGQFTRPYIVSPFVVVTRRSRASIRSLTELDGQRLALTKGNPLSNWVAQAYPHIKIVPVANATEGLEALAAGEVEGAVHILLGAGYFISQHFMADLQIASVFGPKPAKVAMVVAPDNPILKDILNAALLQISPETLKDLTGRWRNHAPPAIASSWSTYKDTVYGIIVVAVFFALVFLAWNHYLRIQILKRRKAERDLQDQLEFSRTLIDGAPVALFVRDREGRLVHCNQAYLDFVKTPLDELIGKTLLESSHIAMGTNVQYHDAYLEALKRGTPALSDVDIEMHGEFHRLYFWILPFQDNSGQSAGVIGGWMDVSEREHLVRQLQEAKEVAIEANRSKSVFLASMSHEIRTPISALIGMIELLRKHQGSPEQVARNLEVAHQSAQTLLSLIGDILDLSKIEAGATVLSPRPTDIGQLVDSAYQLFEVNARNKQLDYRLILETTRCGVMIDALVLNQIVTNLISNAIKYTERGSVYVLLREQPAKRGEGYCAYEIQVGDTGVGLSDIERHEIFEPFVQVGKRSERGGSTGLGLSICRNLARLLDGNLAVESQKGVGSRFTLWFEAELTEVTREPAKTLLPVNSSRRLRILVVEDHAPNRFLLCQQLEYLGHDAIPCNDGESALEVWTRASPPFDLTITDCNLLDMDGYELSRRMRELEFERAVACHPIFGLTANAQSEVAERCIEAGMTHCLFKPLRVETLGTLLAEITHQIERRTLAASADSELEKIRLLKPEAYGPLVDQMLSAHREDSQNLLQLALKADIRGLGRLSHKIRGGAQLACDKPLIDACIVLEGLPPNTSQAICQQRVDEVLMCLQALAKRLTGER